MEQTEGIGIKIYNATPQDDGHVAGNDVPLQTEYRRPFRTLLTFEMVIPSTYHNGECTPVSTMMIHVQLVLCSLSCLFFHFTDSFHGPNGKVYYGFVTSQSLEVFKLGVTVEVPKEERFTLSFTDCACNHIELVVRTTGSDWCRHIQRWRRDRNDYFQHSGNVRITILG
ncbi:unnamed protein product [Ilex paraguariensis]|uniref:SWIM-type domain-containing protein n=1 Tax=Ilex paraguariensis TaxID=185542 RepID=A0ABC8RC07_9AQUA